MLFIWIPQSVADRSAAKLAQNRGDFAPNGCGIWYSTRLPSSWLSFHHRNFLTMRTIQMVTTTDVSKTAVINWWMGRIYFKSRSDFSVVVASALDQWHLKGHFVHVCIFILASTRGTQASNRKQTNKIVINATFSKERGKWVLVKYDMISKAWRENSPDEI